MLKITEELVLKFQQTRGHFPQANEYVNVILQIGTKEDYYYLLPFFLNQELPYAVYLLPVIEKWIDYESAEFIYNHYCTKGVLKNETVYGFFPLLGLAKYTPIRSYLIEHVFSHTSPFYGEASLIQGLLHFDCSDIQPLIRKEIEATYHRNIFPEFIPSLVCKLDDNEDVLKMLFTMGETVVSYDCNAGIILGLALSGENARDFFRKAVYSPSWEGDKSNKGWFYIAIENQRTNYTDFYEELIRMKAGPEQEHSINVFIEMIRCKYYDYNYRCVSNFVQVPPKETFVEIEELLYGNIRHQTLTDIDSLARGYDYSTSSNVHFLKTLINSRIQEGILLSALYNR